MPVADGTFHRDSANRIKAVFVIDEIQITFTGTVSPAMQPFTSNNAKITYGDVNELTATRTYLGRIGVNTFKLTFKNGPVIEGELNVPGIAPASTVNGSGAWESN
ncbi:hypothetical protein C8Q75DRAFT_325938 [Abortiporus biennis]|nr:hypothetical protein C8Q75DRAFT_325938 [Abortiporus biennis]